MGACPPISTIRLPTTPSPPHPHTNCKSWMIRVWGYADPRNDPFKKYGYGPDNGSWPRHFSDRLFYHFSLVYISWCFLRKKMQIVLNSCLRNTPECRKRDIDIDIFPMGYAPSHHSARFIILKPTCWRTCSSVCAFSGREKWKMKNAIAIKGGGGGGGREGVRV